MVLFKKAAALKKQLLRIRNSRVEVVALKKINFSKIKTVPEKWQYMGQEKPQNSKLAWLLRLVEIIFPWVVPLP